MPVAIKRLLLDALKPRDLSIIDLAKALGSVNENAEVEIVIREVDSKTETIKVTVKGPNINHDAILKVMDMYGVSVRGVDEVNVASETSISADEI